jgi:uracil-DNA glycosylase family 4
VDGRSALRTYLEHQRELGTRDLVLDGLTAAEALLLVRAQPAARAPARVTPPVGVPAVPAAPAARAPAAAPDPAPDPASAPATVPVASAVETVWPAGISVGRMESELFEGPLSELRTLADVARVTEACTKCTLSATATRNVPGEGSLTAQLVCVGEAPGANEDATGRPFVGRAGQLLDKILVAIGLAREDVFICNVLKHRPPGNRNPQPDEVAACKPYLVRQIEILRPKVIVAFGTFAAQTLLETPLAIGKLRGQVHRYYGVPLVVTYHPAALLRNPAWKRPTWDDVQYARRILDGSRT